MSALTIDVVGLPAPQGSKKAFYNKKTGHINQVESSKKVAPWRQDVVHAAQAAAVDQEWTPPAEPVEISIDFYLARPRYHFRTGARANELKPNAPSYVDKKPDVDKLARATLDALTNSAVIRDDAQVAALTLVKRYADGATGARITIRPLTSAAASQGEGSAAADTPTPTREGALF